MRRWVALVVSFVIGVVPCAVWGGPLANGEMSVGSGGDSTPDQWFGWNDGNADPNYTTYRSAPNSWAFWDNAGLFQDIYSTYYDPASPSFYVGDWVQIGGYLYMPGSDPLGRWSYGLIHAEFWDTSAPWDPVHIGTVECGRIDSNSASDQWLFRSKTLCVPSGATMIRVIARFDPTYGSPEGTFFADDLFFTNLNVSDGSLNLLQNPRLNGILNAPDLWQQWNDGSHDAWFDAYMSEENSWCFWWDGGLYQDVAAPAWAPGFQVEYSAFFLHPSWDSLRSGSKRGVVCIELYDGESLLGSYESATSINASSPTDVWVPISGSILPPTNSTTARVVVRCSDWWSGDGRFMADDVALRYRSIPITTTTPPVIASGCASAYIVQNNPAVAYWTYSSNLSTANLVYARCLNSEGTGAWTSKVIHTTQAYTWGAPFPSHAIVNGTPAMAVRNYPNDGDLYYFRCSTADGMGAWTSVVVDVTNFNTGVNATLLMVNGKPSISSLSDRAGVSAREIRYYRSSTSDGVGSWTGRTLAVGPSNINTRTCIGNMALIDGKPAIAYHDGYGSIRLLLSTNVNGDGVWRTNLVESFTNTYPRQPHLYTVSGRPAVAYVVDTNTLRYAINSSPEGTGTWSIVTVASDVTREVRPEWSNGEWQYPVKLSADNDGKPVIAYVATGELDFHVVAYAVSSTTDGLGNWTSYKLAQGGFIGSLLQHDNRPLIVHEGFWGVRLTR